MSKIKKSLSEGDLTNLSDERKKSIILKINLRIIASKTIMFTANTDGNFYFHLKDGSIYHLRMNTKLQTHLRFLLEDEDGYIILARSPEATINELEIMGFTEFCDDDF